MDTRYTVRPRIDDGFPVIVGSQSGQKLEIRRTDEQAWMCITETQADHLMNGPWKSGPAVFRLIGFCGVFVSIEVVDWQLHICLVFTMITPTVGLDPCF
jgi:hypothetical protein